jgi:hypothetical protein
MLCAICASPHKVESAHLTDKGMGGRGSKAPESAHDTAPLCAGSGGNTDPRSCHGAHHAGYMELQRTADGHLRYRTTSALDGKGAAKVRASLARRRVMCDGLWHVALYECTDPDGIDW